MLLAALAYVKTYGADSPLWDEYDGFVVALTGEQPVTIKWLWTLVGRAPLPVAEAGRPGVLSTHW